MADFTFKYDFLDFLPFTNKDLETISRLQHLALRPLDVYLCAKTQKN